MKSTVIKAVAFLAACAMLIASAGCSLIPKKTTGETNPVISISTTEATQ